MDLNSPSDELLSYLGRLAALEVVAKHRWLSLQDVTCVELIALIEPGYYLRRPNKHGKVRDGTPPRHRPAGAEFRVHWQDRGGGMHAYTRWVALNPKRRL